MSRLLKVSSNPHIRDKSSTTGIMMDVIIALLPATVFGVYNFYADYGFYPLILILVTIAACVLTEFIYQKLMHQTVTIGDLSAGLTGLLLALNLPPGLPLWIAILGSVFAILVVKQVFGGIGQNFMNPALAARCFLVLSFTGPMTTFVSKTADAFTGATPLAELKAGHSINLLDMFIGNTAGTLGETSTVALLLGAVYLLVRKVINLKIPATYILTVVVFLAIYTLVTKGGIDFYFIAAHLCGGGLMIGAWFMATDYSTSPITPNGRIVFGIFIGLLTVIFRLFGATAEGVSFAIILGNLVVPLIEKWTIPKSFGKGAEKA